MRSGYNPPPNSSFKEFQIQFANHLRDSKRHCVPTKVSKRALNVYRDLLFNNIEDVLTACFPVLKSILKPRRWKWLIQDFFASFRLTRPFYREVPDQFLDYLQTLDASKFETFPFLLELAHYEWMELVLFIADDTDNPLKDREFLQDLTADKPRFSKTVTLLRYDYPVHLVGPSYQPKAKSESPFFYLMFRDLADTVQAQRLNPVSARLLDLLLNTELGVQKALAQISSELDSSNPDSIFKAGYALLEKLKGEGAILDESNNQ